MRDRITVSGILHAEVVSLHAALKAFTFGSTGHIHLLTGFKQIDLDLATDFNLGQILCAKLPQAFASLCIGLGIVTDHRLADP